MSLGTASRIVTRHAARPMQNPVGPRGGDPGAAFDPVTGAFYFATTRWAPAGTAVLPTRRGRRGALSIQARCVAARRVRHAPTCAPSPRSVSAPDAFPIWRSTNLVNWTQVGAVFPGKPAWPTWAVTDFWAPEFHRLASGRWVVYFAARNTNGTLCVGVATSTPGGIMGPYVDRGTPLVFNATAEPDGQRMGNSACARVLRTGGCVCVACVKVSDQDLTHAVGALARRTTHGTCPRTLPHLPRHPCMQLTRASFWTTTGSST